MNKKVIYVSYMHLTDKVSRDWYIDFLISKGVNVEFWDVTLLLRGEFDEFGYKTTDYSRSFKAYSEVEAMLKIPGNSGALYIMLVNYDGYVSKFFRLLSKYDCRMLFFSWGGSPLVRVQKWWGRFLLLSNPLLLIEKVFYMLKGIVYKKLKLVKPFDIVFAAGSVLRGRDIHAVKVVPINLIDYDHYYKVKFEKERFVEGRYAVFLDVNLPYQSDLELVGMHAVNPSEYYTSLNQFFEWLELKCGVKVIIASHPTADYSEDLFDGRQSYQGLTPALVKDAEFVIAHQSTAISYVVLNYKPIIFCYTNEMEKLYKHTYMNDICDSAQYLHAPIYNTDKISQADNISIPDIILKYYDNYKYNYLTTPESEHSLTQDIFWHEISKK